MNTVAILAGGTGVRAGGNIPKQFIEIDGKAIIEYSLQVFENHPSIDEILVVVHPDYEEEMRKIWQKGIYHKWKQTLMGGKERFHSSWAAISACEMGEDSHLLIHDAARPLVSPELIDRLLEKIQSYSAVVPVIPVTDTLVQVQDNLIKSAPNRSFFRQVQTPQAFQLPIIKKAFQMAIDDVNICVTDDCSVVLNYLPDVPIAMVEGDKMNIKLTYSTDMELFAKIFLEKNKNVLPI
ncbi:MAG TPA: 2-C-methyl-D-erythritol 4-phosphate cytidylyltransferase [Bacteroidales bacterium]|nr:2-C-methyl-D-erythritol 4-phosphate cytidylyltransferase [Bacteroidales bacterium]